ncbi:hypothetical protein [Ensifer sp. LCM 4579]|uniref:hypothetical protein n=1 Tax=Ensifer sp. LCM 4579 TaxID=1848292 RepID=UPI0008D9727C|nr:hypothetical protein [Ensifer sp. LCM 4579]OHV81812.1 hypothetical protein LCM4579_18630 [Ensifer sp. LCM 4579]
MKKTLTLLVTSTALTAVIGAFAWSAVRTPAGANERSFAAIYDEGLKALPLILASTDDDDNREYRRMPGRQDGDHEDEDDDDGASGWRNPAPAGSVAPPQNGLFGNGTPPQVKVN